MSFAPCLLVPGTARSAMEDYARIFGTGEPWVMTVGDAPDREGLPSDLGHVIHAQVIAGPGAPLLGADGGEAGAAAGAVLHAVADAVTAARVFEALAEAGAVRRPLGPGVLEPGLRRRQRRPGRDLADHGGARGRLSPYGQYTSTTSASAANWTRRAGMANSAGLPARSAWVMPRASADLPDT